MLSLYQLQEKLEKAIVLYEQEPVDIREYMREINDHLDDIIMKLNVEQYKREHAGDTSRSNPSLPPWFF